MHLNHIALFLQIAEKGSLAAAAREAGLPPTTVSERLAALEAHFGVVLLNRTTRAISLTDEGRTLLEGAKGVLDEVEDLETRIRFLSLHPPISIELSLSDDYVDVAGQGFDMALRFGTITDSSLHVRRLGPRRRVLCAAPAYLARRRTPVQPADLKDHNCLVMRFGMNLDNLWRFGPDTDPLTISVRGDRVANDGALVRQWCLAGHGIILKSELDVGPDIRAGHLVELLANHAPPASPLQMLFPPGRAQPRRVRVLAEQLAQTFQDLPA